MNFIKDIHGFQMTFWFFCLTIISHLAHTLSCPPQDELGTLYLLIISMLTKHLCARVQPHWADSMAADSWFYIDLSRECQMSSLPFFSFHSHTWEAASTPGHSSHWPLSICDTVVSFGTEIWVGIQSSRGAVLSRSDLEKVVHSKFHLTHTERQAGRPWLQRKWKWRKTFLRS